MLACKGIFTQPSILQDVHSTSATQSQRLAMQGLLYILYHSFFEKATVIFKKKKHIPRTCKIYMYKRSTRVRLSAIGAHEGLKAYFCGQKGTKNMNIYQDIAQRTQGDIYIGVVGPVRTGKSTFIKKFMDALVLPGIENEYKAARARDELPQSAAGKTIMTTEPKFVPNEAVEIVTDDGAHMRVRLIDCVGYLVEGAAGHMEDGEARMVQTPWFDYEIPFDRAAEMGTQKVINEHSTIGLVITTDASFSELERANYIEAEARVVRELQSIGKPFVILLNSDNPTGNATIELARELSETYGETVLPVNCATLAKKDITHIIERILYRFPISEISVKSPRWIDGLAMEHPLKKQLYDAVLSATENIRYVSDIASATQALSAYDFVESAKAEAIHLGDGTAVIELVMPENLFYDVLGELSGLQIPGEADLIQTICDLSETKKKYDRIAYAMHEVNEKGYGIVTPSIEELRLEEPEIVRQGNRFGVKLRASAPSIHMIRADIETEVSPIVGSEKQSEELVSYLLSEFDTDPQKIWQSNIFGKSLHELVNEGLRGKLGKMPEDAQKKLQETLSRIINEGSGGLICIIL